MDTDIKGEQMIQGIAFEVEAIPQENTIQVRSPANVTPINVKIRVRKREDAGMQKGMISVPKFGPIDRGHERVRLVSSDQTIVSFNMLMEADLQRKPLRKPRKRFFGGCLGTQTDDDDGPYEPATIDIRDSKSETGMVNTKLMLAANTSDDYDIYVMARKDKKFFGKCKPGGCLDPPFNEEKYSYLPTPLQETLQTQNEKIVVIESPDDKLVEIQSPVLNKGLLRKKRKSSDTSSIKTSDKEDPDATSILSLYKVDTTKTTLDENESDHIITYPPELTSSEQRIDDKRKKHSRSSTISKSRKSFNEINTSYYIPPKKDSMNSYGREENTRNSSDKNISLLRKDVTKDNVLEENESTKQNETVSIEIQGQMTIAAAAAASAIPYILRNTSTGDTEPLKKSSSLDDIKQENIEGNANYDTNKIINSEYKNEKLNEYGIEREIVALRGRPQLGSNFGNMAEDYTSNASAVDEIPTGVNRTVITANLSKSDLFHEHTLNPSNTVDEVENMDKVKKNKSDLFLEDSLNPANILDEVENMNKVKKDKSLDSLPTLNTIIISDPNSEKYSKRTKIDKAAKDAELDGKDDEKEGKAKKHTVSSDTSDMKVNSKQSKKEEVSSSTNNGLKMSRFSGHNYRKHSSIVGKDKYTMDAKPGDRDIRDKEEIKSTKPSLIANSSNPYSTINASTNSGPYYRKRSSSQEQGKSNEVRGKNKNEEMKPRKLSLTANTSDSKVCLKQPKKGDKKEGRFSITSTFENSGPFYRTHSSLVRQDKAPKQSKPEDRDEEENPALVGIASDSNAFESPYYTGDNSNLKLDFKQLKDAGQNTGSQKTIQTLENFNALDRKQSEDIKPNKMQRDYDDISFPTNRELTKKQSVVALQKVHHNADTDQSENEVKFVPKRNLENGQPSNENIMQGKHVINDMKNKKDSTQNSELDNFTKQNLEHVSGETSMCIEEDNKGRVKGQKSATSVYKDNSDKKETIDANYRLVNGTISAGKQSEDSNDTLQVGLEIQDVLPDDHKYVSKQINDLKTTEAFLGGDNINEYILKNLPTKVDDIEVVDTLTPKGSGVDKTISKEALPIHKNKIKDDKNKQQATDEPSTILDRNTLFTLKESLQDIHGNKHNKPQIMKEASSKESIRDFDTTKISKPFTLNEKSEKPSYIETDINQMKITPTKMKVANYFDKIIQGQQNEKTSNQEGITTKPTSSVIRDSIMLDLAFTSYLNDKEEKVLKTLETSVDAKAMDNVVVVKTTVKSDSKDIRIPIDYDNYMSIKIKKAYKEDDRNKLEDISLDHVISEGESTQVHVRTRGSDVAFETTERDNEGNAKEPWTSKRGDNNILQETLTSIYERELVPLQNTIKCLKNDIDILAEQQTKFRDTVNGVKLLRPTRLIHSNKRCGCIRK